MKTLEYLLNKLPSPYAEMAIDYTIQQKGEKYLKLKEHNTAKALLGAFIFSKTDEGHCFWWRIMENAKYEKLQ